MMVALIAGLLLLFLLCIFLVIILFRYRNRCHSLEDVMNSATDAIFVHEMPGGRIVDVNDAVLKIYGYSSKQEVLSANTGVFTSESPFSFDEAMQQLELADQLGEKTFEWRIINRQLQEYVWLEVSLKASHIGGSRRIIASVRNINERKKNESILRESEQLYRSLIEMSPDGISVADLSGKITMINKQMTELMGYNSVEEMTGKNAIEFIDPSDRERVKEIIKRIIAEKFVKDEILSYLKKDGSTFIAEYRGVLLNDVNGNPTALLGVTRDITQKNAADEALRQSKERLQTFMDSATDSITIWDKDMHLLALNNASYKYMPLLNLKENIIGKRITELLPYAVEKERNSIYEQVLKTGIPYHGEVTVHTPDGKSIILNSRIFKVAEGLGILTSDITEQRRIELEVKQKDTKLRSIFLAAPVAIGLTIDRIFYECNEAFYTITGYAPGEIIGQNSRKIYCTEEEYNQVSDIMHSGETNDYPIVLETRWKRKDGKVLDILLGYVPLDLKNFSKGLTFTAQDITDRKQYENALKKRVLALTRPIDDLGDIELTDLFNTEDLQKIQDVCSEAWGVASVITHPDGSPITKPHNFCRFCKLIRSTEKGLSNCYKSDAYIGKFNPGGPIIQPCLSGGLWDAGASITVGGVHIANWLIGQVKNETQDHEKMFKYAIELGIDKSLFLDAINEVPVMSKEQFSKVSDALYVIANELSLKAYQNVQQARLITDLKRKEDQIKKFNEELEKRVEDRTRKLNETNHELESFTYSVSHDLRAPIRHIDGFTKILYSKIPDPSSTITDYYKKIERATGRMANMIDSLLNFSHLGRKDLSISKVDMSAVITEIMETAKPDMNDRDIEWIVDPLPIIRGDRVLLRLAFENLISNAIKYTQIRNKAVIEIRNIVDNDQETEFIIRDNGVGFDMQHAGKLFGVFQRLHSADEFEGLGIGLANVKQIIEKHNGKIRAESAIDKGATFYVTLPK